MIVSAATAQLLADTAIGFEILDLGTHQLKDLERPESVFQVSHAALTSEFPALRSESPVMDAAACLAEGRQAHAANDWGRAYDALTDATESLDLTAEDLERLGEAAWWTGRSDEGISIRERAFGAFIKEGKEEDAAGLALLLAESHKYRLAKTVSAAWVSRAQRLLAGMEQTATHGYLLRWESGVALGAGDPERALALAEQMLDLGLRLGDRDLQALARQDKGLILLSTGQIAEGLSLVDEAMLAAVAGELSPMTTGRSYCNMLAACVTVADYERAGEWSDAAHVWCQSHSDSAYPGVCRMFRAELTWLRGSWDDAAQECRKAISELSGLTPIAGATLHKAGQIELRAGRLAQAAEDFRAAHEHGYTPLPGLAQLRLTEGRPQEARDLMIDDLSPDDAGAVDRARLLPTWIDIHIALNDSEETETALKELEQVAEVCDSSAMRATAAQRRGLVALREGRSSDAVKHLEFAIKGWTEIKMPYEAAESRVLLAEANFQIGKHTAAQLELESARSTFERLGSTADIERINILAKESSL